MNIFVCLVMPICDPRVRFFGLVYKRLIREAYLSIRLCRALNSRVRHSYDRTLSLSQEPYSFSEIYNDIIGLNTNSIALQIVYIRKGSLIWAQVQNFQNPELKKIRI